MLPQRLAMLSRSVAVTEFRAVRPVTGRQVRFLIPIIAVAGEYVIVNATKSTLRNKDVDDFTKDIPIFREFFPEYKGSRLIGILASLYVDEGVIRYAENTGFMVLSVGDQLMEVKNTKGFRPKEW